MRKILLFSLVVMIMASSFVFADNNNIMANVGYRAGTTFSGVDFNIGWVGYFWGGGSSSGSQPSGGLFSGLFQSSASQSPERYTPEYYTPHEYQATSSASLFGHGLGGSASEDASGKSGTIGMHVGLSLGSVKALDWNNGSNQYVSTFNMGLQLGASFRQFLFGGDFFLYEHAGIEVGYPNMMFGVYGDVGFAWQLGSFTMLAGERISLGLGGTDNHMRYDRATTPGFAFSSVTYAGLGFLLLFP